MRPEAVAVASAKKITRMQNFLGTTNGKVAKLCKRTKKIIKVIQE
jgi:hypothetical protein